MEASSDAPLGRLFVCPATADLAVEWAVIAQADDSRRFLLVPADVHPSVGSADVGLDTSAAGGPLGLRCGFAVWVDSDRLDGARCTGYLEPEDLDRALRKHRDVEAGTVIPTEVETEVDDSPEYQDWIAAVPARARALIAGEPQRSALPEATAEQPEDTARVIDFPAHRRWHGITRALGVAASVVLVAGLAFVAGSSWQRQRQPGPPYVNLPMAWPVPEEQLRGEVETVTVPPGAAFVVIVLQAPEHFPEYQLLVEEDGGPEVWSTHELRPGPLRELNVALPRRLLGHGQFRLRLTGLSPSGAEELATYRLRFDLRE